MTRFHIISDIHDDYSRASLGNYQIPKDLAADAIIIAGDIAGRLSRMGRTWLEHQRARTGLPIILVAGNHDFWRGDLHSEIGRFRDRLRGDGIHLLDGDAIEIGGTRIIGATLWTDYLAWQGDHQAGQEAARTGLNDFRYIRAESYRRRLHPWHIRAAHDRDRAAIERHLATPFAGQTIVVTHHAPSLRSLQCGGLREPLDAAYASDLEALILRYRPDYWIHGHIHERRDYRLGHTRILANPRGYRHAAHHARTELIENRIFDERLVLETDGLLPVDGANIDIAIDRPSDFRL